VKLTDLALLLGSTARLTRLVTTDDLGEWYVKFPALKWASQRAPAAGEANWWRMSRENLVSGLDCPFCVGYWLGAANLVAYALTRRSPVLARAWRFGAATLALNYVTAHVSARLDAADDAVE
jgi:Protein of unknown function (DUF1360)